jgi:hypothetical protein
MGFVCSLDLEANELGDDGANSLAQVLVGNKTLTNLNVAGNNISEVYAFLSPLLCFDSPASLSLAPPLCFQRSLRCE